MRTAIVFLLALSLLDTGICLAHGWERTYGGSSNDWGYSVTQAIDGGYIIVGATNSFGTGGGDVYLVKTDTNGDTLWTRTYGGSKEDAGYSIAQTTDGGYIIAGMTKSFGDTLGDVYLVKIDSDGDTLWTSVYGGSGFDYGHSVKQTTDGGYIIAGIAESPGTGYCDVYLIKTDTNGDILWTRTYGEIYDDWSYSVAQTTDGGYIIAGMTNSIIGGGYYDVYLIKTNSGGDTLWTRIFGANFYDRGESVAQTSDGGYIVAGRTESFGAGYYDIYLIKTDSDGDTLWTRTYGGIDDDWGNSVEQTTDGGYIIAGMTVSFGSGRGDVYLVKTDADGDTLWTRTYGGSNYDCASSIAQTSDGGYIVAGFTSSSGAGYFDFYLIKTDSFGYTGIKETPAHKPDALSLTASPNPFNSSVAITVSDGRGLACQTLKNIKIYDIIGNVVWERSPERDNRHLEMSPTSCTFIWTPDKTIPSGIYLIRATTDKNTITKRIILMK